MRVQIFLKDRVDPVLHPGAKSIFTTYDSKKNPKKLCVTKLIDNDVRLVFEYPYEKVSHFVKFLD